MPDILRVQGLRELQVATSRLSRDFGKGVREAFEAAGEPVRQDATSLAFANISGMRRGIIPWHRMRIGVTRVSVYVAPEQRGIKSGAFRDRRRRPGLKRPMLERAMWPAVDRNKDKIATEVNQEVTELFRVWSRFG
jgi:hypothetical protein